MGPPSLGRAVHKIRVPAELSPVFDGFHQKSVFFRIEVSTGPVYMAGTVAHRHEMSLTEMTESKCQSIVKLTTIEMFKLSQFFTF
jgi:hypothetical protein